MDYKSFAVYHLQMTKQKVYFLTENLDQLSNLNIGFVLALLLSIDIYFDSYLLMIMLLILIILQKPDFILCNSFILSLGDKVSTKT